MNNPKSEPGFMAELLRIVDTVMNNLSTIFVNFVNSFFVWLFCFSFTCADKEVDKRARVECMIELPEPTIQHIQSFLTRKEAARTIVLSKSWHAAWLTHPNLHLDDSDFPKRFWEFLNKTVQRYEDSNLKIESLRLRQRYDIPQLANIAMAKAFKLCASHFSFEMDQRGCGRVTARGVFESENLLGLSLKGCGIGVDHNVRCHKLESLSLDSVDTENGAVIFNIISSCPLIRNLSLSNLFKKVDLPKMHNLKCLAVYRARLGSLGSLFFDDLSSKLPALKYLTLAGLFRSDEEEMRICSRSLECLHLTPNYSTSKFKICVPSIKKLVIEACFVPWVSFESTSSGDWESRVSLYLEDKDPIFLPLNELLIALSPSKISLSINGESNARIDFGVRKKQGLPQPRVENLSVDILYLPSKNCLALLDGLFRICRPKFITQTQHLHDGLDSRPNIHDFLFERLFNGVHDLEEVYVPVFDDDCVVSQHAWKPMIEASVSLKQKQKFRFQLVW